VSQPLSACIYLGFDADPSLNIAAKIHGPNDQYINHIINVTGAMVVLRGVVQVILEALWVKGQQPLHLLLSSNNQKSLEDAKVLAENLLETISRECGANRFSSCKAYNAVPPPQQLMAGVQGSGKELHSNLSSNESMACLTATPMPAPSLPSVAVPVVPTAVSYGQVTQPGASLAPGHVLTNGLPHSQPALNACTSYSGYAGIYPLATPLQQVASAFRQPGPFSSTYAPATPASKVMPDCSSASEKRKRKFQESPAAFKGVAASQQVLYFGSLSWIEIYSAEKCSVGNEFH
ncbi:Protein RIK, partial [Bienertia sinuspersici]